eukprot:375471-Prorocentrum_minimum.AAC.1
MPEEGLLPNEPRGEGEQCAYHLRLGIPVSSSYALIYLYIGTDRVYLRLNIAGQRVRTSRADVTPREYSRQVRTSAGPPRPLPTPHPPGPSPDGGGGSSAGPAPPSAVPSEGSDWCATFCASTLSP